MVDRWLKRATITDLGALLAEVGTTDEFGGYFFCPKCQRTTGQQLQQAPAAAAITLTRWRCTRDRRHRGTRWGLELVVKGRDTAYQRLLDVLTYEIGATHGQR